jgi:hypothetical protein
LSGEERVWRCQGSEELEAGRRTPEWGVRFHARISSSNVGPRKSPKNVQVSRDVDRSVTIKTRVIE